MDKIPPLTPEQWERVPEWLKWKIFFILFWEVAIKRRLWRFGLQLGGVKLPHDK